MTRNLPRKPKVLRRVTIAAVAVAACALLFYGSMNWAARFETDRNAIAPSARNSIQHAYAAAETYATLRRLLLPDRWAVATTVNLGLLNEYAEAWLKWPRDTTREAYKDLRNNMIGVIAAETAWQCRTTPNARLRLIGQLAAGETLLWRNTDPRVPDLAEPLRVDIALASFRADRPVIEQAARDATAKLLAETCR